jgi:hypothetical protein
MTLDDEAFGGASCNPMSDCLQYESCSPSLVPSTFQNHSPDLADIKRAEQDIETSSLHGDAARSRAARFERSPAPTPALILEQPSRLDVCKRAHRPVLAQAKAPK